MKMMDDGSRRRGFSLAAWWSGLMLTNIRSMDGAGSGTHRGERHCVFHARINIVKNGLIAKFIFKRLCGFQLNFDSVEELA
jgi:hypothetical protein